MTAYQEFPMTVTIMECTVRMVFSHGPNMIQCAGYRSGCKETRPSTGRIHLFLPKSRILDHIPFVTLSLFQTPFRNCGFNCNSQIDNGWMDGVYDGKHFYSKNLYFISLAHKIVYRKLPSLLPLHVNFKSDVKASGHRFSFKSPNWLLVNMISFFASCKDVKLACVLS